jgi:hypothetical protein
MRMLLASVALVLAGCQTIPENPPRPLSPAPTDGAGRVVIRPFYMPSGANLMAVFMAGGTTAFKVDLYDVTGEPRYLGEMFSPGVLNRMRPVQDAIELDVDPGPRILMLHMRKFGGGDFVNFAEFTVAANAVEHVAITQHGMNDRPYLAKMDFDQKATRHCGSTQGMTESQASEYLKAEGLMPDSKYAWRYCAGLSSLTRPRTVPKDKAWGGPLPSAHVVKLRDQYLPVWRGMADRTPPYDLSQPGQQGM